MSPVNYLTWISENYPGYVGNWPPTRTLTLGTIGTLGPNGFTQHTTITLQPQNSKNAQLSMGDNATIVENPTAGRKLEISFKDENGFVIQATDVSGTAAADLTAVKEQVAKKLQDGDWDPSWYVVVGVQLASVATVIVSQGKGAQLVLDGTVGSPLPLAGDAQLSVASTKGDVISFLAAKFPVIMYRALKVSDAWYFPTPKGVPDGAQAPKPSAERAAGISKERVAKRAAAEVVAGNVEAAVEAAVEAEATKELPEMEELQLKKHVLSLKRFSKRATPEVVAGNVEAAVAATKELPEMEGLQLKDVLSLIK